MLPLVSKQKSAYKIPTLDYIKDGNFGQFKAGRNAKDPGII
jgi:hypothetical protein